MSGQIDLFRAAAMPVARTCGTCVVRNAVNEEQEIGCCIRLGMRRRDDEACADWFGLEQLRRPLYGRDL